MSKAEQAAAAARILAKEPLTPEEQQVAEFLKKDIESYVPPDASGKRVCGKCGAEFEDEFKDGDERKPGQKSAAEQMVTHLAEHNPSAAQWTQAHNLIQKTKPKKSQ
jgi:hypothetical protein